MPPFCSHLLNVEAENTALIQEIHITAGHLLCRLIDYYLFENVMEIAPLLQHNPLLTGDGKHQSNN